MTDSAASKRYESICVECAMTWLLKGDGGICLACRQPVVWKGRSK
jgi:hypothetical protein